MVKVKPTVNQGRITVQTSNDTNIFSIKDNLSEYYAKQAENWAHSEGMVNGIDYSSKYYAEQSKASAQIANNIKSETQALVDGFDNNVQIAKDDIEQNRINSINTIDNIYSVTVEDMQEKSDEVLTSIEASKDEAIDSINSTKTTILNDIEFIADGEKKEIQDIIDNGKDELKESIGDVKVLTTLEIGDIGFTQMAIDETKGKRRYLNGQVIFQDQYVEFTNKVKSSVVLNPDLACTETEWQTAVTMSTNGVCEKFVIDDEAGTIRLPKYPTYLDLTNNTKDTASKSLTVGVKGTGKALGMTDGKTNFGTRAYASTTAIYGYRSSYNANVGANSSTSGGITDGATIGVVQNTSTSGLTGTVTIPAIAGVTSEKIKGTYFIQVATGAETEENIINEIELNNPFSLLDYKYSEYELNNLSWLRSNGQYNSKAIYPAVYDLLLKIYNGVETKAGVSVKLTSETFTDYDFVLNTADETFRLPIKVKLASGKAVVGNGMAIGLTDGTNFSGLANANVSDVNGVVLSRKDRYGTQAGSSFTGSVSGVAGAVGITTDATKSGIETSDSDLYLYFYVGETAQNVNLVNIGRIQETMVTRSMVDGQWVDSVRLLSSATAIGVYTIDLSEYLPNDGYMYEVWCRGYLSRSDTSGTNSSLYIRDGFGSKQISAQAAADGANFQQGFCTGLVVVDANRKIETEITGVALAGSNVYALKYRRLGTNA